MMNYISDPEWIMVFITAVYVFTTIAMTISNQKLVRISFEQLQEEKRHYSQSIVFEHMPFLEMSAIETSKSADVNISCSLNTLFLDTGDKRILKKTFSIRNIGDSIAHNIKLSFIEWDDVKLEPFIPRNRDVVLNCSFEITEKIIESGLMGLIYFRNEYDVEFILQISVERRSHSAFDSVTIPL